MEFTFGIVTNSENGLNPFIPEIIKSIRDLKIPEYEIILVGTERWLSSMAAQDVRIIDFNERIRSAWITKKKNLITQNARYDNIVYQHDYFAYNPGWYEAWCEFGDYSVGMNKLINVEKFGRFRDWSIFPHTGVVDAARAYSGFEGHECLIPYEETGFSKIMYISGGWWMAKKHVMTEFPLNESLAWEQGEDVDWSYRVRTKYKFSINPKASVRLLKYKHVCFTPMRDSVLNKMREYLQKNGIYV
jgi:hypothetical protein